MGTAGLHTEPQHCFRDLHKAVNYEQYIEVVQLAVYFPSSGSLKQKAN